MLEEDASPHDDILMLHLQDPPSTLGFLQEVVRQVEGAVVETASDSSYTCPFRRL
jgi:hypothetical protein